MLKFLKMVLADESGATAIEYGLIVALISIAAVAGFTAIGGDLKTVFGNVGTALVPAA